MDTGLRPHAAPTRGTARHTDRGRNLLVAAGLAPRDALELLPDAELERGAADVEGQLCVRELTSDPVQHLVDDRCQRRVVAGDRAGRRELAPEALLQRRRFGAERDPADAPLGRGHDEHAQGARRSRERDRRARAAGAVRRRRHARGVRRTARTDGCSTRTRRCTARRSRHGRRAAPRAAVRRAGRRRTASARRPSTRRKSRRSPSGVTPECGRDVGDTRRPSPSSSRRHAASTRASRSSVAGASGGTGDTRGSRAPRRRRQWRRRPRSRAAAGDSGTKDGSTRAWCAPRTRSRRAAPARAPPAHRRGRLRRDVGGEIGGGHGTSVIRPSGRRALRFRRAHPPRGSRCVRRRPRQQAVDGPRVDDVVGGTPASAARAQP